jgi:hypothetical protein
MAIKIIVSVKPNQNNSDLNFSLAVGLRFANAEPIVTSTTDVSINKK